MDVIGYLLCFLFGAGAVLLGQRFRPKGEKAEEAPPTTIKRQWDNFLTYDGTERGQRDLED